MTETTMTAGLVSIVIPTYNQAGFLREALESVKNQTYSDWEAIVVNNFSTDNTEDVVTRIGDSRIRLSTFANDGVIARSRNLAISLSRGEFVAFLDSDDLWESTKLAKAVEVLSSGADLVCHAERWFGAGERDRIVRYGPTERATYESLLFHGNCISTSATVMRRRTLEQLGGFRDNPEFITTEDYDLWLRVAKSGLKMAFVDDVLGSFRRHKASASSATIRHLHAELSVLNDHFQSFPSGSRTRQNRRIAFAYYSAGRAFTRERSTQQGIAMFVKALKLHPLSPRAWVGLAIHAAKSATYFFSRPSSDR